MSRAQVEEEASQACCGGQASVSTLRGASCAGEPEAWIPVLPLPLINGSLGEDIQLLQANFPHPKRVWPQTLYGAYEDERECTISPEQTVAVVIFIGLCRAQ